MNDHNTWESLAKELVALAIAVNRDFDGFTSTANVRNIQDRMDSNDTGFGIDDCADNPLLFLPEDVRNNVLEEYYEPGYLSSLQRHFMNVINNNGSGNELQKIINDLYQYAVRIRSHILAHNVMLALSQLPANSLDTWASTLAIAATRNSFVDVQEIGVRCFENWEDKKACEFLKKCKFKEKWLQEYADDVCDYVLGKDDEGVLSKKDIKREMAV